MMNEKEWIPKLYVVVRRDLSPGAMACQAMHAMREFAFWHREIEYAWHISSNHLCLLEVEDVYELRTLIAEAELKGIKHSVFLEPDFEEQLTAATFEPTLKSRELLAGLQCAYKNA